ncbi:hypothetical protein WJX73_004957 [Symbiochloris irregularis]|uniref:Uncharacterized protein n=1 Tax=Symbiochloris irregularis TaxID=706552 RepID=A0AAW1PQM1_9CHLO
MRDSAKALQLHPSARTDHDVALSSALCNVSRCSNPPAQFQKDTFHPLEGPAPENGKFSVKLVDWDLGTAEGQIHSGVPSSRNSYLKRFPRGPLTRSYYGTPAYSSINQSLAYAPTRVCDLESAFYSLLQLCGVQLPWLHSSLETLMAGMDWTAAEPVYFEGKLALALGGSAHDHMGMGGDLMAALTAALPAGYCGKEVGRLRRLIVSTHSVNEETEAASFWQYAHELFAKLVGQKQSPGAASSSSSRILAPVASEVARTSYRLTKRLDRGPASADAASTGSGSSTGTLAAPPAEQDAARDVQVVSQSQLGTAQNATASLAAIITGLGGKNLECSHPGAQAWRSTKGVQVDMYGLLPIGPRTLKSRLSTSSKLHKLLRANWASEKKVRATAKTFWQDSSKAAETGLTGYCQLFSLRPHEDMPRVLTVSFGRAREQWMLVGEAACLPDGDRYLDKLGQLEAAVAYHQGSKTAEDEPLHPLGLADLKVFALFAQGGGTPQATRVAQAMQRDARQPVFPRLRVMAAMQRFAWLWLDHTESIRVPMSQNKLSVSQQIEGIKKAGSAPRGTPQRSIQGLTSEVDQLQKHSGLRSLHSCNSREQNCLSYLSQLTESSL